VGVIVVLVVIILALLLAGALVGIAASLLGGLLADIFDAGWIVRLLVAVALAAIGVTLLESRTGTASSA